MYMVDILLVNVVYSTIHYRGQKLVGFIDYLFP